MACCGGGLTFLCSVYDECLNVYWTGVMKKYMQKNEIISDV